MTFKVTRGQGQGQEMTSVPFRNCFFSETLRRAKETMADSRRAAREDDARCELTSLHHCTSAAKISNGALTSRCTVQCSVSCAVVGVI